MDMDKFVIRPPIKLWELSKSDIDKMVLSTIQMPISGITYIPAIINSGEAKELMDFIDASPWSLALSRRVQHYGYVYDYRAKNVDKYLGEFPLPIEHLRKRVSVDLGITDSTGDFDQAIINEYQPGQGISPHTDHTRLFGDTIVSVSICGDTIMDMSHADKNIPIQLKARSLICLKDDGRYLYTHAIAPRKSDNGISRTRRVSVTFRKVTK